MTPTRGEVWFVDLDPIIGREQAGKRPAVVVSSDRFNGLKVDLAIVVPVTATDRGVPLHIPVEKSDGGLRKRSFAMTEQVRCVSTRRFRTRLGRLSDAKLRQVEAALRRVLDLDP